MREQIAPFDVNFTRVERLLDFTILKGMSSWILCSPSCLKNVWITKCESSDLSNLPCSSDSAKKLLDKKASILRLSEENAFLQFIREEFPKAIVETLLDARMEVENTLLKTQEHYVEWLVQSMNGNLVAFLNVHNDLEKTLSDKNEQGTQ